MDILFLIYAADNFFASILLPSHHLNSPPNFSVLIRGQISMRKSIGALHMTLFIETPSLLVNHYILIEINDCWINEGQLIILYLFG